MASLDFDTERDAFARFYGDNEIRLRDAASSFATLIQLLLTDGSGFSTPVVTCRVKDRDECLSKFKRKYLAKLESEKTPYEIRQHITDLIGLRVVCLYEPDIPLIGDVLNEHFDVLGQTDKGLRLDMQESEFGYKALHFDLRLKGPRTTLAEYGRFLDLQFEVQIRTAIQDAWSTLDHKIKYKRNIDKSLKRRINRLAALFELADQEFRLIRDETREIETRANSVVSLEISVSATGITLEQPLNAAEFIAVASSIYPGYPFDPAKADGFVQELLTLSPTLTVSDLKSICLRRRASIDKYIHYQHERILFRMNPYTFVRHALFMEDGVLFRKCLFEKQREAFDSWLHEQEPESTNL